MVNCIEGKDYVGQKTEQNSKIQTKRISETMQKPLNKRSFSSISTSGSQRSVSSSVMTQGQMDELKDMLRKTMQEEMKELLRNNSLARTDSISSTSISSKSEQPVPVKISKIDFENRLLNNLSDEHLFDHLSFNCTDYNKIRSKIIIPTWLSECRQDFSTEIKYPTTYLMKLNQGPPQELKVVGIVDAAAETNRVIMGMLSKRMKRTKESKIASGDNMLRSSFLSFIHTCWEELHFKNLGKVSLFSHYI